ncbi:unnamed protein product [Eruca vesicaria subsp. sativa]|uniref:Uncharacterized protein n=1 Tax=Eruca vesicaria subsp. sativa TaxID=29727 RepID=A0ABC8LXM8_ERUVS|nr:unnamed protein product [Eruca vesicaria subsp. sativa]
MGCCLSAGKVAAPPVSAAKIPPHIEEETVKEVVVQSVSVPVPDIVPLAPEVSDSEAHHPLPSLSSPELSHNKSDICSVSNSFSTATTTATNASILEDEAISKPRRHPPSSSRGNMSERISRRHSPQGKLRPRMVRERPYNQPNPTHNRRDVDSDPLSRSGLLEGPRRRSQSPATSIRGPSAARRSPIKKPEAALEKVAVEVKKEEEGINYQH